MIIEVGIDGERSRRYQVRRDREHIVVRPLEELRQENDRTVDDRERFIDWRRPQPGIYSLLIDNASYEVFIEEEPDHFAVHLKKRTYRVHAADVRRHRTTADAPGASDGPARITAPIPGRVARVLVRPGQQIERGEGVIVVEAMKMENELRSPKDGVIGTIEVEEGQGVEGGALLATVE